MNMVTLPSGGYLAWVRLSGEDPHERGRALLAALYARYGEGAMPAIRLTERGKPEFTEGPYRFSVSHSKAHVFCCLSRQAVGIDAEEKDRQVSPRLAERYLSQGERARWEALGSRQEDLLRFWVLKEAYAKRIGAGIGKYLSQTDFDPRDPRILTIDGCLVAVLFDDGSRLEVVAGVYRTGSAGRIFSISQEVSMTPEKLIDLAKEAMARAYAPYSGYKVGAALLCADGTVYQGCNIENASFTPTVCAERTAFFKAISDGHRDFAAIAVCGGKDGVITGAFPPCGVCRQVMREFCPDSFPVYLAGADGAWQKLTLSELLPHSFSAGEHMGAGCEH